MEYYADGPSLLLCTGETYVCLTYIAKHLILRAHNTKNMKGFKYQIGTHFGTDMILQMYEAAHCFQRILYMIYDFIDFQEYFSDLHTKCCYSRIFLVQLLTLFCQRMFMIFCFQIIISAKRKYSLHVVLNNFAIKCFSYFYQGCKQQLVIFLYMVPNHKSKYANIFYFIYLI